MSRVEVISDDDPMSSNKVPQQIEDEALLEKLLTMSSTRSSTGLLNHSKHLHATFKISQLTVLARVSRPGWLSWEVCKSGRGWLTRRGVAVLLYSFIFESGVA